IEGHQYAYDPKAQSLSITGGNLLVSQEFAKALGRPSDTGATVGKISVGAAMQPIEIQTLVNGEIQSAIMPALRGAAGAETPTLAAGPDVIVGDLPEMAQYGRTTGSNLCPGCSDPYDSSLNASQTGLGSRAWANPFTGSFPSGANNHSGHNHTGTSHRVTVGMSDLDPSQNPGATYFAEAQYV